jgi:hypothetical protein
MAILSAQVSDVALEAFAIHLPRHSKGSGRRSSLQSVERCRSLFDRDVAQKRSELGFPVSLCCFTLADQRTWRVMFRTLCPGRVLPSRLSQSPAPFPPRTVQPQLFLCSRASQVLRACPTSRSRACSSCGFPSRAATHRQQGPPSGRRENGISRFSRRKTLCVQRVTGRAGDTPINENGMNVGTPRLQLGRLRKRIHTW